MNIKKLGIFIGVVFLWVPSLFAQEDIIKNLEAVKTIKGDFIQINSFKGFEDDVYKGRLYVVMKDKALWDYSEPYVSWYRVTKSSVEQYDEINNQLIRYGMEEAKDNPLFQILMDFGVIREKFYSKSLSPNSLRLTPKTDVGLKYLEISLKDGVISQIKSEDPAGNVSVINFSRMEINGKIPESAFDKSIPKNAESFEAP